MRGKEKHKNRGKNANQSCTRENEMKTLKKNKPKPK